MEQILFYIVRGGVYRSKGNTSDTVEFYEEFKEIDPIISREKAFGFYQNYIDVFLESKGKEYISHEQSEKDLEDFFNSFQKQYSDLGELETDLGIGIEISFVHDNTIIHTFKDGMVVYEGEEIIHGINKNHRDLKEIYFENLKAEFAIYEQNNYEKKNYKKGYNIAGLFEDKEFAYILDSGIDFDKVFADRIFKD